MKLKFARIMLLLTILQLNILTASEVQAQFEKESKPVLEEFFRTTLDLLYLNGEEYGMNESLTQIDFRLLWIFTKIGTPLSPVGVIPAYWMDGVLYVKEMITSYSDDDVYFRWLNKPSKRLVFRRGELVSMDEVSGVDPNEELWKREFSE